ncbi:hypothetical protein TNIN_495211 [Trichonephila inaurata madagascariensis]|uniref:Uncharacterized protein n=1 Tax=Trichonephila inaurata madagascariensis TaxID=2747483 RepID=A0A8X6X6X4_9ARAC|nr:hypothetical protein TNIN_495211 [Trichonephila inaurata madagascariensis]
MKPKNYLVNNIFHSTEAQCQIPPAPRHSSPTSHSYLHLPDLQKQPNHSIQQKNSIFLCIGNRSGEVHIIFHHPRNQNPFLNPVIQKLIPTPNQKRIGTLNFFFFSIEKLLPVTPKNRETSCIPP